MKKIYNYIFNIKQIIFIFSWLTFQKNLSANINLIVNYTILLISD
jgi:hypothetical protein